MTDSAGPQVPRFSMVAYTGGAMKVAGWRFPVVVDFEGLSIPSQARPIRLAHDPDRLVGHSSAIAIDAGRLIAAGLLSIPGADTDKVVAVARNGFPWQASIGTSVEKFDFIKENHSVLVNGRQFTGPVNVVRKATLGEISFVDLGADANTSANVLAQKGQKGQQASAKENDTMTDTETTTATTTTTAQDNGTAGGTPAPSAPPASPAAAPAPPPPIQAAAAPPVQATVPDHVTKMRDDIAREHERIAAIQKLCGDKHPDICAQAVKGGWDVKDTELAILRKERPKARPRTCRTTASAAMCWRLPRRSGAHMEGVEKVYDEKTLDLAARNFRGGIGLQELSAPGRLGKRVYRPHVPRYPRHPAGGVLRRLHRPLRRRSRRGRVLDRGHVGHSVGPGQQVPAQGLLLG